MSEQNLKEKILHLKQEINAIGHNYPLLHVNISFVEKMELDRKAGIIFFDCYLNKLNTFTEKCLADYEDYQAFIDLKNIYSEAFMLSRLSSVLNIEKIPPPPKKSSKSPDFKVVHNNNEVFIEMKALNMAEGTLKHRDIMESAIDGKIDLENKIEEQKRDTHKTGNIVASVVRTDKPYYSGNRAYNDSSPKLIIETLIDKIRQNIKVDQFNYGDSILLVDFSDQLLLPETLSETMQQEYIGEFRDNSELYDYLMKHDMSLEEQSRYLNSIEAVQKQKIYFFKAKGCLWHVVNGNIDTVLLDENETEDGKPEILERQGILNEYDFIKGILFHIDGKFIACMRGVEPQAVFDLFTYLSGIKLIENKSFSL